MLSRKYLAVLNAEPTGPLFEVELHDFGINGRKLLLFHAERLHTSSLGSHLQHYLTDTWRASERYQHRAVSTTAKINEAVSRLDWNLLDDFTDHV